jgi:hypothetical protein
VTARDERPEDLGDQGKNQNSQMRFDRSCAPLFSKSATSFSVTTDAAACPRLSTLVPQRITSIFASKWPEMILALVGPRCPIDSPAAINLRNVGNRFGVPCVFRNTANYWGAVRSMHLLRWVGVQQNWMAPFPDAIENACLKKGCLPMTRCSSRPASMGGDVRMGPWVLTPWTSWR